VREKRKVEVFTAGCTCCDEAVQMVRELACPSCDVQILDMRTEAAQERARQYGVKRVPAVAVNGQLADCCRVAGIDAGTLRRLGVGTPA
jgi:hypothetical protein